MQTRRNERSFRNEISSQRTPQNRCLLFDACSSSRKEFRIFRAVKDRFLSFSLYFFFFFRILKIFGTVLLRFDVRLTISLAVVRTHLRISTSNGPFGKRINNQSYFLNVKSLLLVYWQRRPNVSGMDGLQPPMERIRVRRREGPSNYTKQALEARHTHVQQVTESCSIYIGNSVSHGKSRNPIKPATKQK